MKTLIWENTGIVIKTGIFFFFLLEGSRLEKRDSRLTSHETRLSSRERRLLSGLEIIFRIVSGHDDRPNSFLLGHVSFLGGQMYMMNCSFRGP